MTKYGLVVPTYQPILNAGRTAPELIASAVEAERIGLDSVWVTVDSAVAGEDGGFDRVFSAPFRFLIGAGKTPGTVLSVQLRARDIAGFQVIRDTSVTVVP